MPDQATIRPISTRLKVPDGKAYKTDASTREKLSLSSLAKRFVKKKFSSHEESDQFTYA